LDFLDSLSLKAETFIDMVTNICEGLIRHGFRRILIVNGHGGNSPMIAVAARKVKDLFGVSIAYTSYYTLPSEEIDKVREERLGGHADEIETSLILYLRPELVEMNLAIKEIPEPKGIYILPDNLRPERVGFAQDFKDFTKSGVRGNPTIATPEKGKILYEIYVKSIADLILSFATWDLGVQERPTHQP
jgi:creatinine amidohydrolase